MVEKAICLVMTVLIVGAGSASAQAPDDLKVIPGDRIGNVSLSLSMDDILKLLGGPSKVDRNPTSTMFEWRNRTLRVWQDMDTGRVTSIRVYYIRGVSSGYRTEQGLTIGSHEAEGKRHYSLDGCLLRETATFREFSWPQIGVFFLVSPGPPDPNEIHYRVKELGIRRIGANPPGGPAAHKPCN